MDIQTVTINDVAHHIPTLTFKAKRGEPLTFDEITALERAEWLRDATNAKSAAQTVVLKTDAGASMSIDNARADERVRDLAWAEIAKLGAAELAKDPKLTTAQANVKAMDAPAAAPFMDLYRHPDSNLSARAFIEKRAREANRMEHLGCRTWTEYVSKRASEIVAADQTDRNASDKVVAAYTKIRDEAPEVWREYEYERRARWQ